MQHIIPKENESRKDYLVRVAIKMLEANAFNIDLIKYDEAECDAFCLADDLKTEFNLEEE